MKLKGIMAYGTDEDREKLLVLAQLLNKSQSEYLIDHIRDMYFQSFGDTPPKQIISTLS